MEAVRYIDAHSHLNFQQFDADREEVIVAMGKEGIATITVGTGYATSKGAVELAERHPYLFATIGVHPTDAREGFDAEKFEQLLSLKVVGVGECGLDYYRIKNSESGIKEKQKVFFKQQIDFALKYGLPLMIHARPSAGTMDAYEDALELLATDYGLPTTFSGDFHFFAGNLDIARRAIALGFTLSFDGPITFARDYDEVIRAMPLDMLLAETDAPFAAPVPYRGQRASPLHVREVVKALADIRGENEEMVREATVKNTIRTFPGIHAALQGL